MSKRCPKCGLINPPETLRCDCGYDFEMGQRAGAVQLEFDGTGIQLLGWILLSIVGSVLIVPVAWVSAAIGRWICRNVRFSDQTTATFQGTAGQVLVWFILYLVAAFGYLILDFAIRDEGRGATLLVLVIYIVVICVISLRIIRWWVTNVKLTSAPPLSFTGTYSQLLGWNLLQIISIYSIIGWAWVTAAMYRWFARNTRSSGIEFRFNGKGHQILWRSLVVGLTCLFIIPIPWVALWLMRWIIQNVSMTRSGSSAVMSS